MSFQTWITYFILWNSLKYYERQWSPVLFYIALPFKIWTKTLRLYSKYLLLCSTINRFRISIWQSLSQLPTRCVETVSKCEILCNDHQDFKVANLLKDIQGQRSDWQTCTLVFKEKTGPPTYCVLLQKEFVPSLLNYMLICFRMYKVTRTVVIVYGLTLKVMCKVSRFASR